MPKQHRFRRPKNAPALPAQLRVSDMNQDQVVDRVMALDARLGRGVGAVKERRRLTTRMKELVV